jgi:hypothetical protein
VTARAVARRFESARRRGLLSFKHHHREVAALEPAQANALKREQRCLVPVSAFAEAGACCFAAWLTENLGPSVHRKP